MWNFIDLTGKIFGRLTVINLHSKGKRTLWNCKCSCGKTCVKEAYLLKTGGVVSCGCFRSENTAKMRSKHGFRHHPLYDVWCHMKDRCLNQNNPAYHNYGGRGITICKEWLEDVSTFVHWALNNGWEKGLEVDRENNDNGYCPSNCRIVTRAVNSMNKRITAKYEFNGQMLNTHELQKICGVPARKIYKRVHVYKWSLEKAMELDTTANYHTNCKLKQIA